MEEKLNNLPIYDSDMLKDPAINELIELWLYRDLLLLLILNRIKTRYKRSLLGVVWTLLNPLLNTLVLTIAFSQIFRFNLPNYAIYILSGLIVWNFFAQSTLDAMDTLIWGSSLLKRIYIPRTIFAVAVLGNGLVNFILSIIPLILIIVIMQHPLTENFLALPFAILILAIFTLGISLLISTVAIYFIDFVYIYNVLLSVWFYLTPIIYPLSIIPEKVQPFINMNPFTHFLELFHSLIYKGTMPNEALWILTSLLSIMTLVVSWIIFTRRVDELAYRI